MNPPAHPHLNYMGVPPPRMRTNQSIALSRYHIKEPVYIHNTLTGL